MHYANTKCDKCASKIQSVYLSMCGIHHYLLDRGTHTPDPTTKHSTNKTLTFPTRYYVGRCACVSLEMSEFVLKMYAATGRSTLNKAHCLTVCSSLESAEIVLLLDCSPFSYI